MAWYIRIMGLSLVAIGGKMSELDVRIITLPALKVVSALGFGSGPELVAWDKLFKFLQTRGLWKEMESLEY